MSLKYYREGLFICLTYRCFECIVFVFSLQSQGAIRLQSAFLSGPETKEWTILIIHPVAVYSTVMYSVLTPCRERRYRKVEKSSAWNWSEPGRWHVFPAAGALGLGGQDLRLKKYLRCLLSSVGHPAPASGCLGRPQCGAVRFGASYFIFLGTDSQ